LSINKLIQNMPHRIKKSNEKIFICGNTIEYYHYLKPYFYNFPPRPRTNSFLTESSPLRRDDSLNATRLRLKRIITAQGGFFSEKPVFITFTFKENVDSVDIANREWSLFIMRFNYYLIHKGFKKIEYVSVIEFQKRGAVHYHAIFFNLPFLPNLFEILALLWGNGSTNTSVVRSVNSIAHYLGKYISKGFSDVRLRGRKAYFTSRNLRRPERIRDPKKCLHFLSDKNIIKPEFSKELSSGRFGKISYKQIKI